MTFLEKMFARRYRDLLADIKRACENQEKLILPNGIELNFYPGYDYDNCSFSMAGYPKRNEDVVKEYAERIGQVINLNVYDCFGGDVKLLAVAEDRIYVEIVDVSPCYSCQKAPTPGSKYWIGACEISKEIFPGTSSFSKSDLPF